jgi:hypothetical protein
LQNLSVDDAALILNSIRAERKRRQVEDIDIKPEPTHGAWLGVYVNASTRKAYKPHHEDERRFVYSDTPRHMLAKGGEGAGKSVAGVIKTLERLRRGMSGIMVSPDFEHFKKSLWKEFRRWCPWEQVIPEQQYRARVGWEPSKPFTLTFANGAELLCGGIEEPGAWEGPNVHFAYFDEARRHKSADALKVLAGRIRLTGPEGEPPQLYLTTTPRKHWLFEYFGPLTEGDSLELFKRDSLTVTLRLSDNAENLSQDYEAQRRTVLTEAEARVLVDAEWEDIDEVDRFLPFMVLWDALEDKSLPHFDARTPTILACDGAVSGDTFGLIGISRHSSKPDVLVPRIIRAWNPLTASDEYIIINAAKKRQLNFDKIEDEIKQLCKSINVLLIAYDPKELHHMMTRLRVKSKMLDKSDFPGVPTVEVQQGKERLAADRQLLDLIFSRRISHDGNKLLREHIDNADRKTDGDGNIRIVKREEEKKIDLAVCASMACYKESVLPKVDRVVRSFSGVGSR